MHVPVLVHILSYLVPQSVRVVIGYFLECVEKYDGEEVIEYAMKCVDGIPRADEEIEDVLDMVGSSSEFVRNALSYETFSKVVKKGKSRINNFLIDAMNRLNETLVEDYDSLLEIPYYKGAENIYKIAMYIVSSFSECDPISN